MATIAPTVLAEDADSYRAMIERLYGFATRVHIDVSDGDFAPSFTVAASQVWWPQEWIADIHAMVARPSEHLDTIVSLKPNLVIFHAEVEEDLLPSLAHLQKFGIKAGVALQRRTVPSEVTELIKASDHVMIFSGDLGKYGGKANLMQLEKVGLIRDINPQVEIGWDGGASLDNCFSLTQGGVDVLNVGSYIQKAADPKAAYDKLTKEISKHGVI